MTKNYDISVIDEHQIKCSQGFVLITTENTGSISNSTKTR